MNLSETNSLDGSFGEDLSTGGGIDDFNVDDLESDEDLSEQDKFKGHNLNEISKIKRRDMTRAERRAWLDDDGNTGLRLGSADTIEWRLGAYFNMFCYAPGQNAVIDLTEVLE